ncbi:chloride channel [Delphinella strobiligena]|nr:chloride channel [Delphinella strobiligena]
MSDRNEGRTGPYDPVEASSSRDAYHLNNDESELSDLDVDNDLLSADPMNDGDLGHTISFKRSQKTPAASTTRFLRPFASDSPLGTSPNRSTSNSPTNNGDISTLQQRRRSRADPTSDDAPHHIPFLNNASINDFEHGNRYNASVNDNQYKASHDWYPENHSRLAVPYDDLTAIDWIHEYAKERARIRHLHNSTTHPSATAGVRFFGYLRQMADDSQTWWILVATGIAVGAIAAGIDIAVDWLADLKTGICKDHGDGGAFYLKRGFCCWGYEDLDQCPDWSTWSGAVGVKSAGGGWIVNFVFYVMFSVLFASVAAFLVAKFSPHAKQSGIPEIKTVLGGFVIRRFMGIWTLVTKSLGLALAVGSGMVLGKEGPLVHVACCCANLFMKPFEAINHNEARKREVLSAAAASGISVAFGAPVGGVLFTLEQLSYYFPDKTMWQSFVCAMIAAFTLKLVNPFRTGKTVQYQVTFHTGWHGFEILPYILVGILGGLYGGLFIKLNTKLARLRKSPKYPLVNKPVLEVAIVAGLTALVTFPITFLRAQSTELDYYLFAECIDITNDPLGLCKSGIANTGVIFLLLVSSLIAFIFASLTFGLQIPAGVLLPSITIGALYGRVIGLIVEVWQREHPGWIVFSSCEPDVPCVTPGTYAIIGAASALAGATRMTVSIVVIMFELTGALTYVLPIMIAVMIAKWVGDAMGKRGIYESWIHLNGYPFLDNKDDKPIPDVPVSQIMTRFDDLVSVTAAGHTIASLRQLLKDVKGRGFPVINDYAEGLLLGYISRTELAYALDLATETRGLDDSALCYLAYDPRADPVESLDLRPWMDQTPITLNAGSGFQLVVNMFQRLGLRYLIFVERGVLKGLLTKKDVWFVLNEDEMVEKDSVDRTDRVAGAGVLREQGEGEQRGLLGRNGVGLGIQEEEDEDEPGMQTGVLYEGHRDGGSGT